MRRAASIASVLLLLLFAMPAKGMDMYHWVDSVFDAMTIEERVGQLLVVEVESNLSAQNKELIRQYVQRYNIGGIRLAKGRASEQVEVINTAQMAAKVPLLITHNGDWVARDCPRFDDIIALRAVTNDSLVYAYGREIGRQYRRMGVHLAVPTHKSAAYIEGIESVGVWANPLHRSLLDSVCHILPKSVLPLAQINRIKEAIEQGTVSMQEIEDRCLEMLRYKYALGLDSLERVETKGLAKELNTRMAEQLRRRLTAESITLLGDTAGVIPLKGIDKRSVAVLSIGADEGDRRLTPFQRGMQRYGYMEWYSLSHKCTQKQIALVEKNIENNNTLVVALHSSHSYDVELAQRLCKGRNAIIVSFTTSYVLAYLQPTLERAEAVILAYEDTPLAQDYAAQALLGGIGCSGKLPLEIIPLYSKGMGGETHATRLGYELPEEVGMSSDTLRIIEWIVKDAIKKKAFPGCQVLIARHGKVVYQRSFGHFDFADTHPVTNSDLYDLASVSKAVGTLPVVMRLYDQKRLGLERTLSSYVPLLKKTDKRNITLREALYHESGLPSGLATTPILCDTTGMDGKLYSGVRDENYRIQIDKNYYAHKDLKLRTDLFSDKKSATFSLPFAEGIFAHKTLPDTLLAHVADARLYRTKSYRYSCLNFVLLKEAAERAAGQSMASYLSQYFLRPLGANDMQYNPLKRKPRTQIAPTEHDELLRKQIVIGYPHDELAAMAGGVGGNAGLFANANDLAKMLQMYLNLGVYGDEQYLSRETAELFTTAKSEKSRRGLGFDKPNTEDTKKSPTCDVAPATVYGHTGYTGSCFWVDPTNDCIYIFLTNRIYPNRWNTDLSKLNVRTRIQNIIYRAIENPTLLEVESEEGEEDEEDEEQLLEVE